MTQLRLQVNGFRTFNYYEYVQNFNEDETDDTVDVKDGMGKTSFLFNALKSDDIDGYLEFTGTVLGELTKEDLKSKKKMQYINKLNKV